MYSRGRRQFTSSTELYESTHALARATQTSIVALPHNISLKHAFKNFHIGNHSTRKVGTSQHKQKSEKYKTSRSKLGCFSYMLITNVDDANTKMPSQSTAFVSFDEPFHSPRIKPITPANTMINAIKIAQLANAYFSSSFV